jgi:hypothetical protein
MPVPRQRGQASGETGRHLDEARRPEPGCTLEPCRSACEWRVQHCRPGPLAHNLDRASRLKKPAYPALCSFSITHTSTIASRQPLWGGPLQRAPRRSHRRPSQTAAPTNHELRGLRRGPKVELLLLVLGAWKRKPMDSGRRGDEPAVSDRSSGGLGAPNCGDCVERVPVPRVGRVSRDPEANGNDEDMGRLTEVVRSA